MKRVDIKKLVKNIFSEKENIFDSYEYMKLSQTLNHERNFEFTLSETNKKVIRYLLRKDKKVLIELILQFVKDENLNVDLWAVGMEKYKYQMECVINKEKEVRQIREFCLV